MMNRFIAHNMPKIELHCHLDGSVSLPLIQKLMQQEGERAAGAGRTAGKTGGTDGLQFTGRVSGEV